MKNGVEPVELRQSAKVPHTQQLTLTQNPWEMQMSKSIIWIATEKNSLKRT